MKEMYNNIPVYVLAEDDCLTLESDTDPVILVWPTRIRTCNCKLSKKDKVFLRLKYS